MATSMRPRTGTPIQTPGVVGRVQARTLRNTTHPATLAKVPRRAVQVTAAGASRKRAAVRRRPLTAEAEVGSLGRQVLAVRQAAAVVVVGEAGGEPAATTAREYDFGQRRWRGV